MKPLVSSPHCERNEATEKGIPFDLYSIRKRKKTQTAGTRNRKEQAKLECK